MPDMKIKNCIRRKAGRRIAELLLENARGIKETALPINSSLEMRKEFITKAIAGWKVA